MKRAPGSNSTAAGIEVPAQMRAQLVNELKKKLFDQLGKSVRNALAATENALFDGMDKARDNEARNDLMEALAVFRPLQAPIAEQFLQLHLDTFTLYFSGKTDAVSALAAEQDAVRQGSKTSLSLLNKEEQEENLLLGTMAARISKKYELEMVVMRRRLCALAGASYGDEVLSPLCPEVLVGSLQQALQDRKLPMILRTILFMQFDDQVMAVLQAFYDGLNEFFHREQILPELSVDSLLAEMSAAQHKQRQQQLAREQQESGEVQEEPEQDGLAGMAGQAGGSGRQHSASMGAAGQAGTGIQPGVTGSTPHAQQVQQQVGEINQLLGSYRSNMGMVLPSGSRMLDSFAPPAATKNYEDEHILQALQNMQRRQASGSLQTLQETDVFKEDMYQSLSGMTENPHEYRVAGNQANTVDLVGMLFDFVKDEQKLEPVNKNVLTHLQNLYCQVALQDASFFHNTSHPAHQLLNKMVQVGSEFSEGNESMLVKAAIEQTVQRALTDYQQDDQVFVELLGAFQHTSEGIRQRADRREKRAVEAAKGREKLVFARKHARGFIEVCLKRFNPPEIIREFLQSAWADVLVFVFLRSGPASSQWQGQAKVAEQLAWSCTPLSEEERREAEAGRDQMLAAIQQGLENLGCHSDMEIQRVLQDIRICQQAVQAQRPDVVSKLSNTLTSTHADIPEEELAQVETEPVDETGMSASDLELVEKLKHVRFGTWFEFKKPPQQLKLAWFSPTTQRYMFVENGGQGSVIRPWKELFAQMKTGDARIVEETAQVPFFERALQAIQRTLRQFSSSYVDEIRQSTTVRA